MFTPTSSTGGATNVKWLFLFTTSTNGALTPSEGQIVITAPSGTVLPANQCNYSVQDLTTGAVEDCPVKQLIGTTVRIQVPFRIGRSEQLYVSIAGVTNPPSATQFNPGISLSTTSDTVVTHPSSGHFV
jgi:hypothetical protein